MAASMTAVINCWRTARSMVDRYPLPGGESDATFQHYQDCMPRRTYPSSDVLRSPARQRTRQSTTHPLYHISLSLLVYEILPLALQIL